MRFMLMLLFLSVAGTCFAEDPLETLNTVEDTITAMEQTLRAQAADHGNGIAANSLSSPSAADDAASDGKVDDSDAR